jgi:hypothetical protein
VLAVVPLTSATVELVPGGGGGTTEPLGDLSYRPCLCSSRSRGKQRHSVHVVRFPLSLRAHVRWGPLSPQRGAPSGCDGGTASSYGG